MIGCRETVVRVPPPIHRPAVRLIYCSCIAVRVGQLAFESESGAIWNIEDLGTSKRL